MIQKSVLRIAILVIYYLCQKIFVIMKHIIAICQMIKILIYSQKKTGKENANAYINIIIKMMNMVEKRKYV